MIITNGEWRKVQKWEAIRESVLRLLGWFLVLIGCFVCRSVGCHADREDWESKRQNVAV